MQNRVKVKANYIRRLNENRFIIRLSLYPGYLITGVPGSPGSPGGPTT